MKKIIHYATGQRWQMLNQGRGRDIRYGYHGGSPGVGILVPRPEDEKSATRRFGGQLFEAKETSNANMLR